MNNLTVSIPVGIVIISTIFRLLAARDFWFVVERAKAETGTKNGLETLRKQLYVSSIILLFINTAGFLVILIKPFAAMDTVMFLTNILAVINSVGFWVEAKIRRQIYTQQYTPEQKMLHERIAKAEVTRKKLNKGRRKTTAERNKGVV